MEYNPDLWSQTKTKKQKQKLQGNNIRKFARYQRPTTKQKKINDNDKI